MIFDVLDKLMGAIEEIFGQRWEVFISNYHL